MPPTWSCPEAPPRAGGAAPAGPSDGGPGAAGRGAAGPAGLFGEFHAGRYRELTGEELATALSGSLEREVGRAPERVSCPEGLTGREGDRARCSLTDSGQTLGITVVSTGQDGSQVTFDDDVEHLPGPGQTGTTRAGTQSG